MPPSRSSRVLSLGILINSPFFSHFYSLFILYWARGKPPELDAQSMGKWPIYRGRIEHDLLPKPTSVETLTSQCQDAVTSFSWCLLQWASRRSKDSVSTLVLLEASFGHTFGLQLFILLGFWASTSIAFSSYLQLWSKASNLIPIWVKFLVCFTSLVFYNFNIKRH